MALFGNDGRAEGLSHGRHCTGIDTGLGIAPDQAEMWFDSGPIPLGSYAFDGNACKAADTGYPCRGEFTGTPVPHPGWNGALTVPNTHDMALSS